MNKELDLSLYYTTKEVFNLNVPNYKLDIFKNQNSCAVIKIKNQNYYLRSAIDADIDSLRKEEKNICPPELIKDILMKNKDMYYSTKQLYDKYGVSRSKFNSYKKKNTLTTIVIKNNKYYLASEINPIMDKITNKIDYNLYYTIKQIYNDLQISKYKFDAFRKENDLTMLIENKVHYYLRSDIDIAIDSLRKKEKNISPPELVKDVLIENRDMYYSTKQLYDKFGVSKSRLNIYKKENKLTTMFIQNMNYYLVSEIDPVIDKITKIRVIKNYYYDLSDTNKKETKSTAIAVKNDNNNLVSAIDPTIDKVTIIRENINDYYILSDAQDVLNMNREQFRSLVTHYKLNVAKIHNYKFYEKKQINDFLKLQEVEIQRNLSYANAADMYSRPVIRETNKILTPPYLKYSGGINSHFMYSIADLEASVKKLKIRFDENRNVIYHAEFPSNKYYTTSEVLDILNMNRDQFYNFKNFYDIKAHKSRSRNFYLKEDIGYYIELRDKEKKLYLSHKDACNRYSTHVVRNTKSYQIPPYMRERNGTSEESRYLISELEEYCAVRNLEIYKDFDDKNKHSNLKLKDGYKQKRVMSRPPIVQIYEKYLHTPYLMYIEVIKFRKNIDIEFLKTEAPYTFVRWTEYVQKWLKDFSGAERNVIRIVNNLIRSTMLLMDITMSSNGYDEIYICNTLRIKKHIETQSIASCSYVVIFLKGIYTYIKDEMAIAGVNDRKLFDISSIDKTYRKRINKKSKEAQNMNEIYDVETFLDVLNYTTQVKHHVDRSLNDFNIYGLRGYASTWLLVLIHLNNGWRLTDASNFRYVYISDILEKFNIRDISWFNTNQLTLEQARLIISRVSQREFIITKTQVKGHYFCSDDLAQSVATAIIILTLTMKEPTDKYNTVLTDFNTVTNKPSTGRYNEFFADFHNKTFRFSSKKLNKTLLTYIFSISGGLSENNALKIASKLRGHVEPDMILYYLKLDLDQINKLSRIIFDRGEFGYVYDILSNNFEQDTNSMITSNEERISIIKNELGTAVNIEFLAGFFNDYNRLRADIINDLTSKSFEERTKIINDIYVKNMPSKTIGIQCLKSKEDCPMSSDYKCSNCPYGIPSLLAVKEISQDFYETLLHYHKEKLPGHKIKISTSLNHQLENLSQAIDLYGKELVYSFMGNSRENVMELFEEVLEPDYIYQNILLGEI